MGIPSGWWYSLLPSKYLEREGTKVNRSHALAYSMITLKTAWLKYYYPTEFYAANILNELGDQAKVSALIEEARVNKIQVLAPDINESMADFGITGKNIIRYGLGGIVGVGLSTAEQLVNERSLHGPFINLEDFIYRTNVKMNVLENLIKAGCFDKFGYRAQFLVPQGDEEPHFKRVNELIKYLKERNLSTKTISLPLPIIGEYSEAELADIEYSMLKVHIMYNPLNIYKDTILKWKDKFHGIAGICKEVQIFKSGNGCSLTIVGVNWERYKVVVFGAQWKELKPTADQLDGAIMGLQVSTPTEEGTYFARKIVHIVDNSKESTGQIFNYRMSIKDVLKNRNSIANVISGSDVKNKNSFFLHIPIKSVYLRTHLGFLN